MRINLFLADPYTSAYCRKRGCRTDQKSKGEAFWKATAISATSWAIMSYVMSGTPHILADCGLGVIAMSGVVSWHFLAMYGPLAIGTYLTHALGLRQLSIAAITFLLCALLYVPASGALGGTRLLIAGFGWSLAQSIGLSASCDRHARAPESRFA